MSRLLVVDDEPAVRESLGDFLSDRAGHEVALADSAENAVPLLEQRTFDLLLTDLLMPGVGGVELIRRAREIQPEVPILVISGTGRFSDVVDAMRAGAYDFLQKPVVDFDELQALVDRALERVRLGRENALLRRQIERRLGSHAPIAASPAMERTLALVEKVAKTPSTVLLLGESGTGKEVLARTIHARSPRAGGPFVAINCAALPGDLLEAELFGHEKGAFTGAEKARSGLIESAEQGTLFLDEIGEMSANLQTKLLRVLQEREVQALGSDRVRKVDVRVLAATHRDLEAMVGAREFRQDLYYRLNVFPIALAPLRERREDIAPLAEHFLTRFAGDMGRPAPRLGDEARALLESQAWPGNVRELQNRIERAVILCDRDVLEPRHLDLGAAAPGSAARGGSGNISASVVAGEGWKLQLPPEGVALEDLERAAIEATLEQTEGNVAEAARRLRIDRGRLRHRLRKYGLGR